MVGVCCPWTGEFVVYHEKAYGHPDDMLEERGIRLGKLKRKPIPVKVVKPGKKNK